LPEAVTLLLLAAVYTMLGILIGIKVQKRHHARRLELYKSEARTDALTGSVNRRGFDEIMPFRLEETRRQDQPLSLLFVDIDLFKNINDRQGHEVGDAVLNVLTQTMRQQLRDSDMTARLGGDEFAIVLESTNLQQANLVAERLRSAIDERKTSDDATNHQFTISIGIAELLPGETTDDLLKRADTAAYASKERGRNCCHFHDGQDCRAVVPPN